MSKSSWLLRVAFAASATSVALAGCSSSSPEPAVTVTETAAAATPAATAAATEAPAPAATPAAAAPTTPAGATEVDSANESGMQYTRYKIEGTTAEQVVSDYEAQFKAAGYTITNAGGSGGGWGQWGGEGYGMDASNSGSFASVQAGGSKGGPTYFEVCLGTDESVVDNCGQQSQNEKNERNQNQQNNQNDSNSRGS